MIKHLSLLSMAALLLFAACGQRDQETSQKTTEGTDNPPPEITSSAVDAIIQNIASPIEVAALIHSLEIPFSTIYLADPSNDPVGSTNVEKAFRLGALSADVGYLNIYQQTETMLDYLYGIFQLAGALQIEQFFDFSTLQQMISSSVDMDSLIYITTSSFNRMDDYLRETGRSNLSAMMVTGVWLEGLYLATQATLDHENEELKTLVGEQKPILEDLISLLENFTDDEMILGYVEDLEKLGNRYNDVVITYTEGAPETIEEDGILTVVQHETSSATMSDETLQQIIEVTQQLRNTYLNE